MSARSAVAEAGVEPLGGNYFVAVYPPFSAWRQQNSDRIASTLHDLPADASVPWGLYVHIPFCEKRCNYCYYLSFAGTSRDELARYASRLVREASWYAELPRFANRPPRFVYFGGGTPSLLPVAELAALLTQIRSQLRWDQAEEITFECSPQSVNAEKLAILHAAGVNRISLGVQQLDDEVLRLSGRIHLVADVERAWNEIRAFDFAEVNFDLIAGLPGQTDASFVDGLKRAIALDPDCITIYQLEVPGNTPLFRSLGDEHALKALADWETKRQRVVTAFRILQEHGYESRNAYSAVRHSRHPRFVYTEDQYHGADLVGIGLSSFSYVAGTHYQNTTSVREYSALIDGGQLPAVRSYVLSSEERMIREFILQLKLGSVRREHFRHKFAADPVERFAFQLRQLEASGLIAIDETSIGLTAVGLVRVDRLLPAFYLEEHQACPSW
jgi:oxygen-independent coproporphyrinogen-3 oxidase